MNLNLKEKNPAQLARLLSLGQTTPPPDSDRRYGPMLECQLRVPLAVDLPSLTRSEAMLRDLSRHLAERPGETFGQLLSRPDPPLLLLNMVKAFAKSALADPNAALPREVATLLYCAAIAAGLVRLGQPLTRLSDDELAQRMQWSASRPWIGSELATLFNEAQERLRSRG